VWALPRHREDTTAVAVMIAHMRSETPKPRRKSCTETFSCPFPMSTISRETLLVKMKATSTMLRDCPKNLIVERVPEPTPSDSLETDPITALVFGELNRPYPKPKVARIETMAYGDVSPVTLERTNMQMDIIANPIDTSTLGCILSERRPLRGETAVIRRG